MDAFKVGDWVETTHTKTRGKIFGLADGNLYVAVESCGVTDQFPALFKESYDFLRKEFGLTGGFLILKESVWQHCEKKEEAPIESAIAKPGWIPNYASSYAERMEIDVKEIEERIKKNAESLSVLGVKSAPRSRVFDLIG